MLDVAKLATLRAVVAHGSFSAAAHELDLTQPAVSRQVSVLERRLGTQLVTRTQRGVHATEAGRLLIAHANVVLDRLALAESQLADLAGLRSGHVRLGSFFTALVFLSAETAALLEDRHPALFHRRRDVIEDVLVDRATALRLLSAADLDVAIVFEHEFEPQPPPAGVELETLFHDPTCALLPAAHRLARAASVTPAQLASETWIRAHHGSAARLVEHVLSGAELKPRIVEAGYGDEPVEAQALVAAGRGVMVAHRLNVLIDPERIAVVALRGGPVRRVQCAVMSDQRAPAALAVVEALREVGRRRAT